MARSDEIKNVRDDQHGQWLAAQIDEVDSKSREANKQLRLDMRDLAQVLREEFKAEQSKNAEELGKELTRRDVDANKLSEEVKDNRKLLIGLLVSVILLLVSTSTGLAVFIITHGSNVPKP